MPMINTFGVIGGDERMKYWRSLLRRTVIPCVSAV